MEKEKNSYQPTDSSRNESLDSNDANIVDLTPPQFICAPVGFCPSIFEIDGDYIIVGKQFSNCDDIPAEIKKRIAPDEGVVIVPKGLLAQLKNTSQKSEE